MVDIDDCVAAWLWDIRHATDMECASVLFAKSLFPQPPELEPKRLVCEDNKTPELILGGQIPVGLDKTDGCSSGLGTSFVSEYDDSDSLRKTHCSQLRNSSDSSDSKDSVLSESCVSTSSAKNSPPLYVKQETFLEPDQLSMDSACGGSPVGQEGSSHFWSQEPNRTLRVETHRSEIPFMPCYTQLKDGLHQILTTTGHLYALLVDFRCDDNRLKLLSTVRLFVEQSESVGCGPFVRFEDLLAVKCQTESLIAQNATHVPEQLCRNVRAFSQQVLIYATNIILRYLAECDQIDNELPSALQSLARLALFSEEIRLKVIQVGAIRLLHRLCVQIQTRPEVIRLSLRALAVLCSCSKGCVQLQSLGGFELIVRLLCESAFSVAVEAAGVLCQLTAPTHSFAALPPSLPKVIFRLIDLCDQCSASDSYLLCSAALANLCLQHGSVTEQLYRHNAVLRISRTFNTPPCCSVFVQEQLATIFARLSANGYDQALVSQGAIPCLLQMLRSKDNRYEDLCKRIRYKAAICLGTVAVGGYGLKAVYDNKGFDCLIEALRLEKGQRNPVNMICHSLISRLQAKYELETFV